MSTEQPRLAEVNEEFSIWFWVGTDASFSFREEITFYVRGTQHCQINKIRDFIISWNTLARNFLPITVILLELALRVWKLTESWAIVLNQYCLQSMAEFLLNSYIMEQWKPWVFLYSHKDFLNPKLWKKKKGYERTEGFFHLQSTKNTTWGLWIQYKPYLNE